MVSWTKGHFELIADTVNENMEDPDERMELCKAFSDELRDKNPFFDNDKFMKRCWNAER